MNHSCMFNVIFNLTYYVIPLSMNGLMEQRLSTDIVNTARYLYMYIHIEHISINR